MSRVKLRSSKDTQLSAGCEKINTQVQKASQLENQQMFNDGVKDAIKKQAGILQKGNRFRWCHHLSASFGPKP